MLVIHAEKMIHLAIRQKIKGVVQQLVRVCLEDESLLTFKSKKLELCVKILTFIEE